MLCLFQDAKVAAQNMLREARSNQRRLATAFGDLDTGELLKFNQLKVFYQRFIGYKCMTYSSKLSVCSSAVHILGEAFPTDCNAGILFLSVHHQHFKFKALLAYNLPYFISVL